MAIDGDGGPVLGEEPPGIEAIVQALANAVAAVGESAE